MQNDNINKSILSKGFQQIGAAILLMFIGPSILYVVLSHKDKSLYEVLLGVSFLLCIAAIVLFFLGIKTLMKAIFKDN